MSFSDVSGASKYFVTPNEGFSTTTSGATASGATTVGLNSVSGLTNGTTFVGVIEPAGTKEQIFTGVVDTSGSQITGVVWTKGSNIDHATGVSVVDYDTGTALKLMTTGLLKEHTQTGTHGAVTATSVTSAGALTGTSLVNAVHTHANNAGGGQLTGSSALVAGTVTADSVASGFPVQMVQTDYSADTSGSTVFPADDTIPQITEGFEVMTQAVTPKATGNSLIVQATVLLAGNSASRSLSAAIFQDATANALAATTQFQAQSGGDVVLTLACKVAAASTASTTFRVRIGSDNGGTTVTFGNARFSTAIHSHIRVIEVKA